MEFRIVSNDLTLPTKTADISRLSFNIGPYGKNFKLSPLKLLYWDQTLENGPYWLSELSNDQTQPTSAVLVL